MIRASAPFRAGDGTLAFLIMAEHADGRAGLAKPCILGDGPVDIAVTAAWLSFTHELWKAGDPCFVEAETVKSIVVPGLGEFPVSTQGRASLEKRWPRGEAQP